VPTLPLPRRARARARVEAGNQRPWPADKVERWSIDRLIPYAKNARTHTDAQVAAIAASIKEWGWTTPALVGEDGGLIAGHARVLAARQLGIAKIPVMVAAGWTEAQKRAYVLADNQCANPLPRRARARARVEAGNQRPWPADKVERWSIDRLIPYAKNARTHTDAQVAAIAASIKEWGWTTPALVGEDGGLIAGHARVLAARQLGIAKIPVMVAAGWTEAQKRAYVLADNQLAITGSGWDTELLLGGGQPAALKRPTAPHGRGN
jgi:ParB-like chromosome segregation protein Spo0J